MSTDFRKLAVELCLADGKIDETEVRVIKKALYQDGKIDQKEVEFLIELRSLAQKKAKGTSLTPAFENFFFKALEDSVLDNGIVSSKEANFLRKAIFADGKIEDSEKRFMKRIKNKATKTSPQFERLYTEVVG